MNENFLRKNFPSCWSPQHLTFYLTLADWCLTGWKNNHEWMNAKRNDLHWKCARVQKGWALRPLAFSLTRETQNCNLSKDSIVLIQSNEYTASLPREQSNVEAPRPRLRNEVFLIDPCKLCRSGLSAASVTVAHRRQCHHRYTCWLLAPKESIFAESEGKMPVFSSMSLVFSCQMNEWKIYFY